MFTAEKLMFVVWMLLPVGFAPFFSRNKSLLVLLIPMAVVNLMSNWQYQYNVSYQYTYGSAALIVFMLIVTVAAKNAKTAAAKKRCIGRLPCFFYWPTMQPLSR